MSIGNQGYKKKGLIAVLQLVIAVGFLLSLRWLFYEPFIIPSGSMIPTLLIHDHIVVDKNEYGIRYPFTEKFIGELKTPSRGEIVVFNAVKGNYFMIKRLIALPGDEVSMDQDGQVTINGQLIERKLLNSNSEELKKLQSLGHKLDENYKYFLEDGRYVIRQRHNNYDRSFGPVVVPESHLFMVGDNRDNSADSRIWGMLPINKIVGKATTIWMSCEKMLSELPICSFDTVRSSRLMSPLK